MSKSTFSSTFETVTNSPKFVAYTAPIFQISPNSDLFISGKPLSPKFKTEPAYIYTFSGFLSRALAPRKDSLDNIVYSAQLFAFDMCSRTISQNDPLAFLQYVESRNDEALLLSCQGTVSKMATLCAEIFDGKDFQKMIVNKVNFINQSHILNDIHELSSAAFCYAAAPFIAQDWLNTVNEPEALETIKVVSHIIAECDDALRPYAAAIFLLGSKFYTKFDFRIGGWAVNFEAINTLISISDYFYNLFLTLDI